MFKKIITVGMQIINFNYKNYENFTKIIIEQGQAAQQPQMQPTNRPPNAPHPNLPPNLPRREGQPPGAQNANQAPVPPPAANNQSFNINTNTFIDDEEYGLNI